MITTQRELEFATQQADILRGAIALHEKTQPVNESSLKAFAKALHMLSEIEAAICLYSIRKENLK